MKFNITKDQLKGMGNIGLKIGKQIVIEGTKAMVLKTAMVTINTAFSGEPIKSITLDDVLSGKKKTEKIFEGKTEVVDPKTGDVYRKVTSFDHACEDGLDEAIDI